MNKFLVVHDTNGRILAMLGGNPLPEEPVGVPFKWVEIPEGKILTSIDVELEKAVFQDIPPSDVEKLRTDLDNAILELSMMYMGGLE